jgi:subtilisin family serine protease
MKYGPFAASALALLAVLATSSADSGVPARHQQPARVPEGAQLMAFGGRSAEQRSSPRAAKLDAALADLSRHLGRVRSDHALEDLHSLSPAARFVHGASGAGPLVAVDAVTRGDPARLKQALVALGLQHPAVYSNDVGGWLPVDRITAAAALDELVSIRASMPHARGVVVTSQGDFAQNSDMARANNPGLTGAGVKVGILSDSFNCYGVYDQPGSGVPATTPNMTGYAESGFATDDAAFDETNGYLPASISVLEEGSCMSYGPQYFLPFADEGRAMMQIVHDVAPGAALAFYTGSNTQADFAAGITALAAAGATVIADDIGYYDEPFFQDGVIAQAINAANAKGVAYFSAAGNDGQLSYENNAANSSFVTPGSGQNAGELLLTFGMNGATRVNELPVTIASLAPGEFVALIVEWDQPFVTGAPGSLGAASNIDLCVTAANGYTVLNLDDLENNMIKPVTCTGANSRGKDAEQVLILGNPASNPTPTTAQKVNLIIGLATDGSPAPNLIKLVVADDGAGSTIDSFGTNSPTIQGHPGAAGAAAVGAAFFDWTPRCGKSPAQLEYFSSAGGDPILFDTSGKPQQPQIRQKPDFVGPDGVNTSFFGFLINPPPPTPPTRWSYTPTVAGCQNDNTYNSFLGTSAATPHVAGVAALMLQANSALKPADIYGALRSTALPMGNGQPDYLDGAGFIQADKALASLPPGPPVMQLAASSITVGGSTNLTWSAYNVTSCNASGSWSGAQKSSGSVTVTPAAAGTENYTLTCMNAHGSAQHTATLTVQAGSSSSGGSGGGGGGLDGLTLLGLMSLGCARTLAQRARSAVRG